MKEWVEVENIPSYLGGTSRGSLIDDVGPWREEHAPKLRVDVGSGSGTEAAPHVDTAAQRAGEDEDEDEFMSVTSDVGGDHGDGGDHDDADDADRVAVMDKKIRELRKMLGIVDKASRSSNSASTSTASTSVYDDLSKQLDSIMDRVSEILGVDDDDDDETAVRVSTKTKTTTKTKTKARCGCC